MMELLDSLVILQVEWQKYRFWINIKLFSESKCKINFFQNSNREMDFGKRDQLSLWDHARS
jgi:hypothetical protein